MLTEHFQAEVDYARHEEEALAKLVPSGSTWCW